MSLPFINFFATAARADRYLADHDEPLSLPDGVLMGRLDFGGLLEAEPTVTGRW